MPMRASLFSLFESRIVRATNLEFSRRISKYDRNSKILSRTILFRRWKRASCSKEGKTGPRNAVCRYSNESPIPPTTPLPSYPSTRATRGFRRSKLSSERESKGLESWIPPKLGRPRVSGGGEGAAARSVEDLSSSNTGSSSSFPPRIPSLRLSSQENLHFSLIVLHQRACVHRDITAERSS